MYKKPIILLLLLALVGCGTKSGVITTKKDYEKRYGKLETVSKEENKQEPQVETENPSTQETETLTSTSTTKVYKDVVAEYIDLYNEIAVKKMTEYGIPASITLAQGILESGAGRGTLTKKANNHFGIKCHKWEGESVYHDDDEKGECFRKYSNPEDSFNDHSLFLTQRSRYDFLFELPKDDYKAWARGLKKAGYATDRKYPQKLISLIERYELHQFDKKTTPKIIENPETAEPQEEPVEKLEEAIEIIEVIEAEEFEVVEVEEPKVVETPAIHHVVKQGDTLYSISKQYNISLEELKTINNLSNNSIKIGQKLKITTQ